MWATLELLEPDMRFSTGDKTLLIPISFNPTDSGHVICSIIEKDVVLQTSCHTDKGMGLGTVLLLSVQRCNGR